MAPLILFCFFNTRCCSHKKDHPLMLSITWSSSSFYHHIKWMCFCWSFFPSTPSRSVVLGKGLIFFNFFLFYFLLKWMSIIDPYLISINTIEIPCSWRMGLIDAVWHGTTCPRLSAGQISEMRTRTCCKIKILNLKIGKQSEARGFNPVAVFYLCLIWSQVPVFGLMFSIE